MINCKTCGTEVSENVKFCSQCGTPTAESIAASMPKEPIADTAASQIPPTEMNTQIPSSNAQTYTAQNAQPQYNTQQQYNTQPQYNGQPQYQQSNYSNQPYPQMIYQKTNGLCIAGFIVSLVGIIPILSGIVGLILSILGMKKAQQLNEKGRGFAIAGIIIGALNILAWIAYIIIVVYVIQNYGYYY